MCMHSMQEIDGAYGCALNKRFPFWTIRKQGKVDLYTRHNKCLDIGMAVFVPF